MKKVNLCGGGGGGGRKERECERNRRTPAPLLTYGPAKHEEW